MPFLTVQPLGALGATYLEISPAFVDRVAEFHRHALRLLESPMAAMGGGTAWADLGWCALTLGDMDIASESFEKGMNYPSMFMRLEMPRYLAGAALLASNQGHLDAALHRAEEACVYAEDHSMRHMVPLVRLVMGRILAARGAHGAALEQLARSAALAADLRLRPVVWQAHAAAAQSLAAMGRHAAADVQRQAARAVVDDIAATITDGTLRAAYRASALASA